MIENPAESPSDSAAGEPGERPSKTRRKQEVHALQALGTRLTQLNRDQIERLALPEELREAVLFAQQVSSHEGRRRQLQYVGKLMRRADADAIRAGLDRVTGASRAEVTLMHRAEQWRERLLADDQALTDFVAQHPQADVQWLRTTIRAARRDQKDGRAPRHARELYRWLHDCIEGEPRGDEA